MISSAFLFFFDFLHLLQRHIDGVQQRGGSSEREKVSWSSIVPVSLGQRNHQPGLAVELHQEEFVVGVGDLEEPAAAMRERLSFSPMLPLVSKTRPAAMGSSSMAKW